MLICRGVFFPSLSIQPVHVVESSRQSVHLSLWKLCIIFSHKVIQELLYVLWEDFLCSFHYECMTDIKPYNVLSAKIPNDTLSAALFFLAWGTGTVPVNYIILLLCGKEKVEVFLSSSWVLFPFFQSDCWVDLLSTGASLTEAPVLGSLRGLYPLF